MGAHPLRPLAVESARPRRALRPTSFAPASLRELLRAGRPPPACRVEEPRREDRAAERAPRGARGRGRKTRGEVSGGGR